MIKYTWSAPLVEYGRFEVTWEEGDTPPDSGQLGRDYADWLAGVMRAYDDRKEEIRAGAVKTVKDTLGATEVGEEPTPAAKEQRSKGRKAIAKELEGMGEEPTKVGDTVTVAGMKFTKHSESPFPEHGAPTSEHKHVYVYADDESGHSGSFCACGAEEPNEDAPSWERKVEKSEPWKTGGPVKKPAKIEWN